MNFDEISRETSSLMNNADALKRQYKEIVNYLTSISGIVARHDSLLANDINRLIDRYYDMINLLNRDYLNTIDDLNGYINTTNKNFDDLAVNIAKVTSAFNACIDNKN